MAPEAGRRALGSTGEKAAEDWYRTHGYEIVARNWRCREGEIDLVLRQGRQLVFCEVKARSSAAFGTPAEAVTRAKQLRLRRLASRWMEQAGPVRPGVIRFDVASVLSGVVEIIEGAF